MKHPECSADETPEVFACLLPWSAVTPTLDLSTGLELGTGHPFQPLSIPSFQPGPSLLAIEVPLTPDAAIHHVHSQASPQGQKGTQCGFYF